MCVTTLMSIAMRAKSREQMQTRQRAAQGSYCSVLQTSTASLFAIVTGTATTCMTISSLYLFFVCRGSGRFFDRDAVRDTGAIHSSTQTSIRLSGSSRCAATTTATVTTAIFTTALQFSMQSSVLLGGDHAYKDKTQNLRRSF